jgi:hypothetical protein
LLSNIINKSPLKISFFLTFRVIHNKFE